MSLIIQFHINESGLFPSASLLAIFDFWAFDAAHESFDAGDGLARIESLGAGLGAVEDGMTTVHRIMILEFLHSLFSLLITGVHHPAVGLHQHRRAEIFVAVPPVRWTRGGAASAEDALVHAIQLGSVLHRLKIGDLAELLLALSLKIRFNLLVLIVEIRHVGDEVLDDVHVWQRVNLGGFGGVGVNSAEAGERVGAIDVHGARATDSLSARSSESQRGIQFVLDFD